MLYQLKKWQYVSVVFPLVSTAPSCSPKNIYWQFIHCSKINLKIPVKHVKDITCYTWFDVTILKVSYLWVSAVHALVYNSITKDIVWALCNHGLSHQHFSLAIGWPMAMLNRLKHTQDLTWTLYNSNLVPMVSAYFVETMLEHYSFSKLSFLILS